MVSRFVCKLPYFTQFFDEFAFKVPVFVTVDLSLETLMDKEVFREDLACGFGRLVVVGAFAHLVKWSLMTDY